MVVHCLEQSAINVFISNEFLLALSLKSQLQQRLGEAIAFPKEAIYLRRSLKDRHIFYRTGIAFKLAANQSLALKIATDAALLLQNQPDFPFLIQVVPPGWLDFQLSDRTLATWLQSLLPLPSLSTSSLLPTSHFSLQYTHARCCSLLRLAHREGLIHLSDLDQRQLTAPNPIPWINELTADLRLVHSAEQNLIFECLGIVDELDCSSQPNYLKLEYRLSNAF